MAAPGGPECHGSVAVNVFRSTGDWFSTGSRFAADAHLNSDQMRQENADERVTERERRPHGGQRDTEAAQVSDWR